VNEAQELVQRLRALADRVESGDPTDDDDLWELLGELGAAMKATSDWAVRVRGGRVPRR